MGIVPFGPPTDAYADLLSLAGPAQAQLRRREPQAELREGPTPTVLDTSCVRTGLQDQLKKRRLPASLYAAQVGQTRLFMEHETVIETWNRLPRFAEQLGVPVLDLQRIFADQWLPLISVVKLPEGLRQLDERALTVRDLDPEDYPTAALAALLSPCILLTRNHKHFSPLDVREPSQGVDAVLAAIGIHVGETRGQVAVMIPAAPVVAVGAVTKWAFEKIGPVTSFFLGLLVGGGIMLYWHQPPERKKAFRKVARGVGEVLLGEVTAAMGAVQEAENQLSTYVVPRPANRTPAAAVLRMLATADDSMSAQQLYEALDPSVRPAVAPLRAWLHGNKTTVFKEARRGSFQLGRRYALTQPLTSRAPI